MLWKVKGRESVMELPLWTIVEVCLGESGVE